MSEGRILLKLSGEILCGPGGFGLVPERASDLAGQFREGLAAARASGKPSGLAVIFGGGNYLRGAELAGSTIGRVTADQMGMLGTVMNALGFRDALEAAGLKARVYSALGVQGVAERYDIQRVRHHLANGRVVLLAGGTGNPFFTTDTCAALRALELDAELLAKGTKVDGIFSDDPKKNPDARLFERVSFREAVERRFKVMDSAAFSLCMDHRLPIQVFNMWEPGNIERVIRGERIGTRVE